MMNLSKRGGAAEPHGHDVARYAVQKTDAQWREQLDPMQFKVARQAATERPFNKCGQNLLLKRGKLIGHTSLVCAKSRGQ